MSERTTLPVPPADATVGGRDGETDGPVVVALDVGGTDIKAALLDAGGVLLERVTPTRAAEGPRTSFAAVLAAVADVRDQVPAGRRVAAVGLAVPGTVDEETGVVRSAENLDWVDLPVRALVEDATGLPVGFGHDVRAGGLAEWRLGAARGAHDHAFLAVGTGIAAAVVLRGEPYVAHGWAGEVGHGGAREGEPCPCGGRGCAETFASAAGMARTYRRRTGAPATAVPGAREVLARAQAGDAVARDVWERGVDRLGELVAEMTRLLALPTVVVGGGLVRAGDALLRPLDAAVRSYLTIHPAPRLVPAQLGSAAGVHGAALLGWDAARAAGVDAPRQHAVPVPTGTGPRGLVTADGVVP
ncbi:glucokinase [Cellulosimicrobium aquatile]|uniref:Glucokinase n=1 Tax=Cellulosimicrobium aquatile TaxID=1612203 RepID=A0A1N6PRY6_9MICO|nr:MULTISPECIES: ROK family protein [Cellulosimicrobium]MCM3535068.1 ROK family protein [Cellulosimicrobium funkei]SIQ07046.1 glucokinase [Cellulosimicrobium aquatile]